MHDVAFQLFSGVSLVLILMPISWHLKALNTGTLSFIFWVFFGNLFYFINAIIWYNKLWDPAPVWCDITAKFQVGMSVGIPAACLCTNRRLYLIATMQLPQLDTRGLRRLAWKELSLTAGLPALVMILHYVVQGRRYDIVQGVGCWAHTYWSWAAIWLVFQWPFTIGLASLAYGAAAFLVFRKSHLEWNENLKSKSLGVTKSRYIRLMALSCAEMGFTLPLGFWIFYLSVNDAGINPWISWDYVHAHWYDIEYRDDLLLQSTPLEWVVTALTRWCLPISAIAFFVFFGLSGGATKEYVKVFRVILKNLHLPTPRERNVEAGETFAQFAERFVVDYEPPRDKNFNDEDDDECFDTPSKASPNALYSYAQAISTRATPSDETAEAVPQPSSTGISLPTRRPSLAPCAAEPRTMVSTDSQDAECTDVEGIATGDCSSPSPCCRCHHPPESECAPM